MNIERLRNDDGEGSENVTIKMYSGFFRRFHVYSNSSKFPGVEYLGTAPKFGKREQNPSWLIYFLQTISHIKEISRGVRAGRAKKCTKEGAARANY